MIIKAKSIINEFNLPIDTDTLSINEEGFIDFKGTHTALEWIKPYIDGFENPNHDNWEWQEIGKGLFYQGGTFPVLSVWDNFFLMLRERLIEEKDKEFPGLIKVLEESENFTKGHNSQVLRGWRVEPLKALALGDTNKSWRNPLRWVIGVSASGEILPEKQIRPEQTSGPIGDDVFWDEKIMVERYLREE